MKQHTRWKRKHPSIIGKRFFDAGEYGLGFFTVLKAWRCKEYSKSGVAPDDTHWFDKHMILIKTDSGLKYKIPYCPWAKVTDAKTGKWWDSYYNERPW